MLYPSFLKNLSAALISLSVIKVELLYGLSSMSYSLFCFTSAAIAAGMSPLFTDDDSFDEAFFSEVSCLLAVFRSFRLDINRLKIDGCYSFFLDGDDISLFKCVTYPLIIMVVVGTES
jgi:hypothetical protein